MIEGRVVELADLPPVMTVAQLVDSHVLPIGRAATYAGIKSGEIPSIRVGRRLLIPRAKLAALLGESDIGP